MTAMCRSSFHGRVPHACRGFKNFGRIMKAMRSMNRVNAVIAGLIAMSMLHGCLRYVPPRSELEKSQKTAGSGDTAQPYASLAGEDEFLAYEQRQKERQNSFVNDRHGEYTGMTDSTYVLGPGDVINLQVYGFPDLSADYEIASDGSLSLPLVGDRIPAAGKRALDLRQELNSRFSRFIRNPRVQMAVKDYKASQVFVTGEVSKPGTYPLHATGQQLLEVIAEAGGRTDKAGSRVIVIPGSGGGRGSSPQIQLARGRGVEFNMDELVGNADDPPLTVPLHNGDTIIIPEAGNVEVYGEVERPGNYPLGSKTSALGAVASAGGFTYSAKVDEVEIIRDIGGGKKAEMTVNLEDIALRGAQDLRLRDGDIVRVPSDPNLFGRRQAVEVINSMFRGVGVSPR